VAPHLPYLSCFLARPFPQTVHVHFLSLLPFPFLFNDTCCSVPCILRFFLGDGQPLLPPAFFDDSFKNLAYLIFLKSLPQNFNLPFRRSRHPFFPSCVPFSVHLMSGVFFFLGCFWKAFFFPPPHLINPFFLIPPSGGFRFFFIGFLSNPPWSSSLILNVLLFLSPRFFLRLFFPPLLGDD